MIINESNMHNRSVLITFLCVYLKILSYDFGNLLCNDFNKHFLYWNLVASTVKITIL